MERTKWSNVRQSDISTPALGGWMFSRCFWRTTGPSGEVPWLCWAPRWPVGVLLAPHIVTPDAEPRGFLLQRGNCSPDSNTDCKVKCDKNDKLSDLASWDVKQSLFFFFFKAPVTAGTSPPVGLPSKGLSCPRKEHGVKNSRFFSKEPKSDLLLDLLCGPKCPKKRGR